MSCRLALATALALGVSAPALAQEIHILDPYARAASPAATTGAAFMLIDNIGDADDRLVGAASPVAQMVQIHTHREEDGVMKMLHLTEGLPIGAGDSVILERGGHHLMFMGLTESFEQGKEIPLTLIFEKSGEITLDIPVDLARKAKGHGH
ncbi:MAG: copper chaperone PCu(A)C [Roseovarius sp.]|nr:copper chaperone PCu(A)C [Roseovarius sp.]